MFFILFVQFRQLFAHVLHFLVWLSPGPKTMVLGPGALAQKTFIFFMFFTIFRHPPGSLPVRFACIFAEFCAIFLYFLTIFGYFWFRSTYLYKTVRNPSSRASSVWLRHLASGLRIEATFIQLFGTCKVKSKVM